LRRGPSFEPNLNIFVLNMRSANNRCIQSSDSREKYV